MVSPDRILGGIGTIRDERRKEIVMGKIVKGKATLVERRSAPVPGHQQWEVWLIDADDPDDGWLPAGNFPSRTAARAFAAKQRKLGCHSAMFHMEIPAIPAKKGK